MAPVGAVSIMPPARLSGSPFPLRSGTQSSQIISLEAAELSESPGQFPRRRHQIMGERVSAMYESRGSGSQGCGRRRNCLDWRPAPIIGAAESTALHLRSDWKDGVDFEGHYSICARYCLDGNCVKSTLISNFQASPTLIESACGLKTEI